MIYDTSDDYSKGLRDSFKATAEKLGIAVAADEGFAKGAVDFRPQLTNIKSKNPDVLFVPTYYEQAALIAVQAKELGLTTQIVGADGWDGVVGKVDQSNMDAVNGAYYCSSIRRRARISAFRISLRTIRQNTTWTPINLQCSAMMRLYDGRGDQKCRLYGEAGDYRRPCKA